MSVLFVHSHYGEPGRGWQALADEGRLTIVRERELSPEHFATTQGIVTTTHLDQIGFMGWKDEIAALFTRGGSWFFNGHTLKPFVDGLSTYRPLGSPKRADLRLTRLFEHPIYQGIPQGDLEENKGVAGFYGRGHNPMPAGGTAVNGISAALLPIDWEWRLPGGGRMFSHAGNDLGGMGADAGHSGVLTRRIAAWAAGEI
ncbi:hypothetical protein [Pelagibacterium limicola]|uniref:hypothetical protein n=1 Tax=Pelagibacterium limicola TaxID=2791022 RepID=UPI0018B01075|nr:hypothetical protein [Pelagibacterium limicola]